MNSIHTNIRLPGELRSSSSLSDPEKLKHWTLTRVTRQWRGRRCLIVTGRSSVIILTSIPI